jgi:peptidoglycan hydrolase-like protein with peptidoglycan-binding domain
VALGYHYALPDTAYDSVTEAAVASFQARAGLPKNGVADLATQSRLLAATAPRSAQSYRYGSHGDDVRRIQQRLIDLKFLNDAADGRFGPKTEAAVKAYQKNGGLSSDGIVGPRTVAKLFYAPVQAVLPDPGTGSPSTPAPTPDPQPQPGQLTPPVLNGSLRRGSTGEAVRQVQLRLAELHYPVGSADGKFGPMTEQAVRLFQRKARITVDGIVGPQTIQVLYSTAAPVY